MKPIATGTAGALWFREQQNFISPRDFMKKWCTLLMSETLVKYTTVQWKGGRIKKSVSDNTIGN